MAPSVHAALLHAGAIAALALPACSSSKDAARREFGPTYKERMASLDKIIKRQDFSARSSFEKQVPKTATGREIKAASIASKPAGGLKQFRPAGTAGLTKDYAEAGRKSLSGGTLSSADGKNSKMASKLFRVPENSTGSAVDPAAGRVFPRSGQAFNTFDNRAASAEIRKDNRPVILEPEKPTYTEDEIRRLLNK